MYKSFFLSFLIILACFSGLNAQATVTAGAQWEYLVFSFGVNTGTTITAEKDAAKAKIGSRQSYYGDKLVRYSDNASYQAALDELGRSGWELVSVIPNTEAPANPIYVFKRQYNSARSQKETDEVEKLEKDARAGIKPPVTKLPLVDLDRAEVRAADEAVADKAKQKLEQAIKNAGLSSLVSVRTQYNSHSRETWAELTIDGSGVLLKDGNKYRTSDAKKYISEVAAELFKKSGLQQLPGTDKYYFENGGVDRRGEIVVNLAVFIKYNGKDTYVSRGAITGNWMASNQQEE